MGNIANYQEEKWLQETFIDQPVYCGLVETGEYDAELEAGTLDHEITDYTGDRKPITFAFTDPPQQGGKATIKNTVAIEFENMPAVTVKYAIVCDAETLGHILYWCPLAAEKASNAGDTFRIPIDDLVLDLE